MNWKRYGLLFALTLIAGLFCGAVGGSCRGKSQDIISAKQFSLVDKDGKARAILSALADGPPHLALCDKDGKPRVLLAVLADGEPGLYLLDKDGKAGAFLHMLAGREPGLWLYDKDGNTRASLRMLADGQSSLALLLFDKDGKVIWSAPQK